MASRDFEMPELKILIDAVQSSRFITIKKSRELIAKLKKLTSNAQAHELQRQVFIAERNKSVNENIYYNIDKINSAVLKNKQISFKYYEFNIKKEKIFKKDGQVYMVNPYVLIWSEDKYYLILNNIKYTDLSHYRVDRMVDIKILKQPINSIEEVTKIKNLNIAKYVENHFSMYPGEEQRVYLRFHNSMIDVAIDRFGQDISIIGDGEQHFILKENIKVSPTFIGWLLMLGKKVEILKPQSLIEEVLNHIKIIKEIYQ